MDKGREEDELLWLKCLDVSLEAGDDQILLMDGRGLVADVARPVGVGELGRQHIDPGMAAANALDVAAHLQPRVVGIEEDAAVGKLDHRRRVVAVTDVDRLTEVAEGVGHTLVHLGAGVPLRVQKRPDLAVAGLLVQEAPGRPKAAQGRNGEVIRVFVGQPDVVAVNRVDPV
jgi:hypothetical protein